MYTQCPECGTAFRITAEVLKQAAGKVRCGGCSVAFNALEYLSEQKPAAPVPRAADGSVPELTPESVELEAVDPPKTISAEQSAALLKTLDELAGSDIRIEDTGLEWRVLDEREEASDDEASDESDDIADTGSMKWFIDESPTPVDEPLSAEPGAVDAPEIFEEEEQAAASVVMRFDDDTPLPDDFDFDQQPAAEPESVMPIESRDDPSEFEAAQVDLALGEPEDWEDLLGEVDEPE
ncbi:MAG: zinc-ribbon domain-containing protein, partial [Woeseiaceae bacterium]|nr:zinc-ribbon domain-containing protein [Woeseiaceae bacterium]